MKVCTNCGSNGRWLEMSNLKQEPWEIGRCRFCNTWLNSEQVDTLGLSPVLEDAAGLCDVIHEMIGGTVQKMKERSNDGDL